MAELFKEKTSYKVKGQIRQQEHKTERTDGKICPFCGQEVPSRAEICPHCGRSLVPYCTFCGSEIPTGETECPECGMPREGVKCPRCGTLNARAYCRNCNEPLTPVARKELERAMKDPLFIKAASLTVELAELELELEEPDAANRTEPELHTVSPIQVESAEPELHTVKLPAEKPKSTQKTDGSLSDSGKDTSAKPQKELPPEFQRLKDLVATAKPGIKADAGITQPKAPCRKTREQLREEYARKKAELNATFKEMVPPPGSTPQEQRNYYSARRMPVRKTIRGTKPIAWVCNVCSCRHNNPSECYKPELGGTWQYEEYTITVFE